MSKIIEFLMHQKLLIGLVIFMLCITGYQIAKNLKTKNSPITKPKWLI